MVALALIVAPVAVHADERDDKIVLSPGAAKKLDPLLKKELKADKKSRVIVRSAPGTSPDAAITKEGGPLGRKLSIINGRVTELTHQKIAKLAEDAGVSQIDLDRAAFATDDRTNATTGVAAIRSELGLDGAGVGVAIVDSGVSGVHDDLLRHTVTSTSNGTTTTTTVNAPRVAHFADFVGAQTAAYDDYGHGTHVAGIVVGTGYDSSGNRTGVAPGATVMALKALDNRGNGTISNIIAAIDYAVTNRATYNIRVINLSIGAGVYQSFTTDPLTVACRRAADLGMVVVAAAGNLGRNADGSPGYRRITAPGNAPWVLTIGASSHMGTVGRNDDTIAGFSSRGPTHVDRFAKPDLVAPGVGIESLSDAASYMYSSKSQYLLPGTVQVSYLPYLSLSGTSMSTPVVSGAVALMLQANPQLTPNAVKAILQFTAQVKSGYDLLTQGGGFLNTRGAVRLARYFANPAAGLPGGTSDVYSDGSVTWSRHLTWGNHRIGPGMIRPGRNAWRNDVVWGAARTPEGTFVAWGTTCPADDPNCENVVWGSSCPASDPNCDNVVWGSTCPAEDPNCDNVVWGSNGDDNVVWSSNCPAEDPDCDNVVWGSSCPETDPNCDNVVWGSTTQGDNVVWGSDCPAENPDCENVVWGSSCPDEDPSCDNVVWGSDNGDNVIWGFDWRRRRDLVEDSYVAFRHILSAVKGVL